MLLLFTSCITSKEAKFNNIIFQKIYETDEISNIDSTLSPISACLDPHGFAHVLIPTNSIYICIDTNGRIIKKINLSKPQHGELLLPVSILIHKNQVTIFDSYRRLLVFYDDDFNILKKTRLTRYPNKFRLDGDYIYYSTDFLSNSENKNNEEIYYGNKIYKQHLISKEEEVIYCMDSISIKRVLVELDLKYPLLLDFDYSINTKTIYCAPQRYDKLFILAKQKKAIDTIINNTTWEAIPYTEEEKQEKYNSFKQFNLGSYPIDKVKIEYKFALNSLAIDPEDNIWIISACIGHNTPIDIYSTHTNSQCSFQLKGFNDAILNVNKNYFMIYELDPIKKRKIALYKYKLINK